jgi:hypothetical protein
MTFKNSKFFYLIFSLFLIILIWLFTASSQTRCSKFGIHLLDNIFGLDGVAKYCYDENLQLRPIKTPKDYSKVNYYSNVNNKVKKECPINSYVIVIIGQSNASNYSLSNVFENKNNLNFNPNNNQCYELSEPVLGATGAFDSITSSIGKKIITNEPVIFVNRSVGGSTIDEWNQHYSKDLNSILKKILEKNILKSIIWIQGESETFFSRKKYFENFKILKDLIFKDLNVKFEDTNFIITKSTYCRSYNAEEYISKKKEMDLQREMIKKKWQNVKLLEITDNLDNSYRRDDCHLNRKGIDRVSAELAESINLILQKN